MHFCAFDDYERWRRDHPRPAAKRLADLNVGEPRTVRMIYFSPADRTLRQEVVDSMKVVIPQIQTFYGEQMQEHGYGEMTFTFGVRGGRRRGNDGGTLGPGRRGWPGLREVVGLPWARDEGRS